MLSAKCMSQIQSHFVVSLIGGFFFFFFNLFFGFFALCYRKASILEHCLKSFGKVLAGVTFCTNFTAFCSVFQECCIQQSTRIAPKCYSLFSHTDPLYKSFHVRLHLKIIFKLTVFQLKKSKSSGQSFKTTLLPRAKERCNCVWFPTL